MVSLLANQVMLLCSEHELVLICKDSLCDVVDLETGM